MKRFRFVPESIAIVSLLAGCAAHDVTPPPDPADEVQTDSDVVNGVGDSAMANAILAEHTLYPYHFVANGKELNELGQQDLDVLAKFYRTHPGDVNIRRGDVPAPLVEARTQYVEEALMRAGVDTSRVKLANHAAGGDGMSSEDVIRVLETNHKEQAAGTGYPDSSNTGGESGSGASTSGDTK